MIGRLSDLVVGAAAKRLRAVEALPSVSNQHELNGVQALKSAFGEDRHRFPARFIYVAEEDDCITSSEGFVTWYDAREEHATRSEFRLYFPKTDVSSRLSEGDLALILRLADGSALLAFAREGSTSENQLLWLFNLAAPRNGLELSDVSDVEVEIGFAARTVLALLGLEPEIADAREESHLQVLLEKFGDGFPNTADFSTFARDLTTDVSAMHDPDDALMAWLEREEALFRLLEHHLVSDRLVRGFEQDVDAFISFSLSVQNRRKSRAGHALEHHAHALFVENGIRCTRNPITEGTSRPDFVFPGIGEYRDQLFPVHQLTVLAAKSSCKDRWRQILQEADRIPKKHLLTLEPRISAAQTSEMHTRQVALVVPRALHPTFTVKQRSRLLTVADFIQVLRERQVDSAD